MIIIHSIGRDLNKYTTYSQIARPKASKATKVLHQHKRRNFDDAIINSIDNPKRKTTKLQRQQAAQRQQQRKTK